MKITEDYVRKTIEEVTSLVEQLSGLKCNLEGYEVNLVKDMSKIALMTYQPKMKIFSLEDNFTEGNQDFFKICIGHEVMHNAQYSSFPNLMQREDGILWEQVKYELLGRVIGNPLKKLIEGDARNIEKKLNTEYFKNSKLNFLGIPLIFTQNIKRGLYDKWGDILNKRFNWNRIEINKLYSYSSLEELIDIFGSVRTTEL